MLRRSCLILVLVLSLASLATRGSAQTCQSPLPTQPTPAQVLSCVNEMQKQIDDLTEAVEQGSPILKSQISFVRPPRYGPNWSTHGGEYTRNFEYGIDRDGIVHLRGLMTGCPNGQPIFNLPVGFRPSVRAVFGTIGGAGTYKARVDVMPNGDVQYLWVENCNSNTAWLTLDGISFKSEQ